MIYLAMILESIQIYLKIKINNMRKNYISPEFKYIETPGTFNMIEESTYYGAKMLEVDDVINIENSNLIWYQNENGEQLDYSIEFSKKSFNYSSIDDKFKNHTLDKTQTQTDYQLNNNTQWELNINIKTILFNYIFASMKKYRTFDGIKNDMTKYNDVNTALANYINRNVLDRYKFKNIELFIKYKDINGNNLLKHKNDWVKSDNLNTLLLPENKTSRLQSELISNNKFLKVLFSQEKSSSNYVFDYYFNIYFEKI